MTRGRPSLHVGLVAALLAASGCVLLVPETKGGPHCKFAGAGTDCGQCLQRFCSTAIDEACSDGALLASVVPRVEGCAARGDASCSNIPDSAAGRCLKNDCGQFCFEQIGVSETRCTDSFFAPGLACSCSQVAATNDLRCGTEAYPRARCCAPTGWPAPSLECACNAVACTPTSDGCICILTENLDANTAQTCQGAHCCAVEDRCQCRARPCSGGEREVSQCSKAELACPDGTTEVASCAIRR